MTEIEITRYGRWTVLARLGCYSACRCDCGTTRRVQHTHLTIGKSKSCGCYKREAAIGRSPGNKRHGMTKARPHNQWSTIKARCLNPTDIDYSDYGGRGIKICDRWRDSFEAFVEDMGICPDGLSIGRIDNYGNYEKSNCRWETAKQQANNRRSSVFVELNGERHTIAEWSEITGIGAPRLYWRYHRGWPPEKILDSHDARL